jgi:hypothetical protein
MFYNALVLVHVLSVIGFFLVHGATAVVMFRLRAERDPERMRALLSIRDAAAPAFSIAGLLMFISGIVLGFMGKWWGDGWIWTALGLLIAVSLVMSGFGRGYLDKVQALVRPGGGNPGPEPDPDAAALAAVARAGRPWLLTVVGLAVLGAILWLMLFKPF